MSDKSIPEIVDKLFSRNVLGSVFVGLTIGKVIEKIITLGTSGTEGQLYAWMIASVLAIFLFIFWHRIENKTDEIIE